MRAGRQLLWGGVALSTLLLWGCGSSPGTSAGNAGGTASTTSMAVRRDEPISATKATVTVPLRAGWNAVGLQYQSIDAVTPGSAVGVATYANGTYQTAGLTPQSLTAAAGAARGCWVFTTGTESMTYSGTSSRPTTTVSLSTGWNLVSTCSAGPVPFSAITASQGGTSVPVTSAALILEIDPTTSATTTVTAGGELKAGRAFWVFALADNIQLSFPVGSIAPPDLTKKDTQGLYQAQTTDIRPTGGAPDAGQKVDSAPERSVVEVPNGKKLKSAAGDRALSTFTGNLSGTKAFRYIELRGPGNTPLRAGTLVTARLTGPDNADFDLYLLEGSPPTTTNFAEIGFRAGSTESTELLVAADNSVWALIVSYQGSGNYQLTLDANATPFYRHSNLPASGSTQGNLATAESSETFELPSLAANTELTVTLEGPAGSDFDLFGRVGRLPLQGLCDGRGYTNASRETIRIVNRSSSARPAFVTVRSYRGSGQFTLTTSTRSASSEIGTLAVPGQATGNLENSGARYFRISGVQPGAAVRCSLTGPENTDFDLYGASGSVPSRTSHELSSLGGTSTESFVFTNGGSSAQDFFVMVYSYSGAGSFTLRAESAAAGATAQTLTLPANTSGNLPATGSSILYRIPNAPRGTLTATLSGPGGTDFDIFMRTGGPAHPEYDAAGVTTTSSETVTLNAPGGEDVYIRVLSFQGSGAYTLTVRGSTAATALSLPGTANGNIATTGEEKLYRISNVPADTNLVLDLTGPASGADFDLYAKRGTAPSLSDYDVSGAGLTASEHLELRTPSAGDVFVLVRGYSGSGNFELRASTSSSASNAIPLGGSTAGSFSATGESALFVVRGVPANTPFFATLSGPSGVDFDLFASRGQAPTTTVNEASSVGTTSTERIELPTTATTDVYLLVTSFGGSGAFTLTTGPGGSGGVTELARNGSASGSLSGPANERSYVIRGVPANSVVTVNLSGPSTSGVDFDLYLRKGSAATATDFDANGFGNTATESVSLPVPQGTDVFVLVRSYSGSGSFTLSNSVTTSGGGGGGAGSGRTYAVIVGINEFATINRLQNCVNDARGFRDAVTSTPAWSGANITYLTDRDATKAAITAAVNRIVPVIGSSDRFVLFVASHGSNSNGVGYICAHDTPISEDELHSWLAAMPANAKKLVICDTCFSGAFIGLDGGTAARYRFAPIKGSSDTYNKTLLEGLFSTVSARGLDDLGNIAVIMSCAGSEVAGDGPVNTNGTFTGHLLDGLGRTANTLGPAANGNNDVTAREAYDYAAPRVSNDKPNQNPQILDRNGFIVKNR